MPDKQMLLMFAAGVIAGFALIKVFNWLQGKSGSATKRKKPIQPAGLVRAGWAGPSGGYGAKVQRKMEKIRDGATRFTHRIQTMVTGMVKDKSPSTNKPAAKARQQDKNLRKKGKGVAQAENAGGRQIDLNVDLEGTSHLEMHRTKVGRGRANAAEGKLADEYMDFDAKDMGSGGGNISLVKTNADAESGEHEELMLPGEERDFGDINRSSNIEVTRNAKSEPEDEIVEIREEIQDNKQTEATVRLPKASAESESYYIYRGNKKYGPFTVTEIRQFIAKGKISMATECKAVGGQVRITIGEIPRIRGKAA